MELNNFSFSAENVDAAIKYLKGKGKDQPSFLKKKQFKVKDGSLYVQDRMVIPDEQRDTFLRELVYGDKKFPFGRDSLFHMASEPFKAIHRVMAAEAGPFTASPAHSPNHRPGVIQEMAPRPNSSRLGPFAEKRHRRLGRVRGGQGQIFSNCYRNFYEFF